MIVKIKQKKMQDIENNVQNDVMIYDQIFLSIQETYFQDINKNLINNIENLIRNLEKWNIFSKITSVSQNGKMIPKPLKIWHRKINTMIESKSPEIKFCGLALIEYSVNNFSYENLANYFSGWFKNCQTILSVRSLLLST